MMKLLKSESLRQRDLMDGLSTQSKTMDGWPAMGKNQRNYEANDEHGIGDRGTAKDDVYGACVTLTFVRVLARI